MEKIFDGMVAEEELVELSKINFEENGADGSGSPITDYIVELLIPTGACTPSCRK